MTRYKADYIDDKIQAHEKWAKRHGKLAKHWGRITLGLAYPVFWWKRRKHEKEVAKWESRKYEQ